MLFHFLGETMGFAITGILSVFVLGYLIYVMFNPEKF